MLYVYIYWNMQDITHFSKPLFILAIALIVSQVDIMPMNRGRYRVSSCIHTLFIGWLWYLWSKIDGSVTRLVSLSQTITSKRIVYPSKYADYLQLLWLGQNMVKSSLVRIVLLRKCCWKVTLGFGNVKQLTLTSPVIYTRGHAKRNAIALWSEGFYGS
jgi:hypothetical protein